MVGLPRLQKQVGGSQLNGIRWHWLSSQTMPDIEIRAIRPVPYDLDDSMKVSISACAPDGSPRSNVCQDNPAWLVNVRPEMCG
jgi:hypothetical protein